MKGSPKGSGPQQPGGGKGKGMYNVDPATADPQRLWQLQATEANTWDASPWSSGTFSFFHLRGDERGEGGWTDVHRRPRCGEPMKVNLADLVKKPKQKKENLNRFEALKEMDEQKFDADLLDDVVPEVPASTFQRVKGKKKLSDAYHPAGCAQKCCRSLSTAPSDFSLFALS